MTNQSSPPELILEARVALGEVREALLTPTPLTVEQCAEPLTEAARRLRLLDSEWARDGNVQGRSLSENRSDRRKMAAELLKDLAEVQKLLQQAGAYYLGWSRILLSAIGNYDRNGQVALSEGHPSVTLEG